MKTWRQGVIGCVSLAGQPPFYLQCLTYPLAARFEGFNAATGELTAPLGLVKVRLADFGAIERVGEGKLTAAQRRTSGDGVRWSDWYPTKEVPNVVN